jgi:DNA (cytosine-5)-methyltransferase 1
VTRGVLKHVDLYAGVGGFTLGFESAGAFDTRLLVDSDESARTTFKRNRPRVPYWRHDLSDVAPSKLLELAKLAPEELDVLTAGPPCQGLSKIGSRQLDDKRNRQLKHTAEIIDDIRPKLAIIENVPALYWDGHAPLFDELSTMLHDAGYDVCPEVLEAWRYGVPQLRRRLFILVVREDVALHLDPFPPGQDAGPFTAQELIRAADAGEPKCPPGLSVEEAIGDLPSIAAGGGEEATTYEANAESAYQRARRGSAALLFNHRARTHSEPMLEKIRMIKEGGRNFDLGEDRRLRADEDREYFSQAYARLHRGGIAQTITTYFHNPGSGRFIHYQDDRSLTVREAARFQSFDDDVFFVGKAEQQMRHVGNAVPMLLAKALAEHCREILVKAGADIAPEENVVA